MTDAHSMKGIWEIIKGTLTGLDNQGSAKRATAAFVTGIILCSLVIVYEIAFLYSVRTGHPNRIHVIVVEMFLYLIYAFIIYGCILLGLATLETITTLVKTIRGKEEVRKDEA